MKRSLQVHSAGFRKHEQAPEAVTEFMSQSLLELGGGTPAILGHQQFHEIADIADKPLCEFGASPRPTVALGFELGIEFAHAAGARGKGGKRHGREHGPRMTAFNRGPVQIRIFNAKAAKFDPIGLRGLRDLRV